jgi:hypothetical protein
MRKFFFLFLFFLCSFSCVFSPAFSQDNTWFKDVTSQLGFDVVHAGGIVGLDVNNDNYPDLITMYGDNSQKPEWRLYINTQAPGSNNPRERVFVDATDQSGLFEAGRVQQLMSAGDFNNDGNIDIVINAWFHDSTVQGSVCVPNPDNGSRLHLLLGDGRGRFTLKANSGLEALGPLSGTGLPTLDFDRDGNLDLFVATHYNNWCYAVPQQNYLLKGNGDGTFTDVSQQSGIANPPRSLFGANIADWNNDCHMDILTAPYEAAGYGNLFRNNGDGTFTDVAVAANYNPHFMPGDNGQPMVPWAAMPCDYDNDGDIDFLVLLVHGGTSNNEGRSSIFTSSGAAGNYQLTPELDRIIRKSPKNTHHGDHNGFWSDFNNDGLVDLVVGDAAYTLSPATDGQRMFFCLQDSGHRFTDITQELGFISGLMTSQINDKIRRPSVMLPIDYDMDGDDDIFKAPYNSDDSMNFLVLRNDIGDRQHYVKIKLLAPPGVNKSCIGARITVKAGGVKQMREIYGGQGSWTNQYPFIQNFGLGGSTYIDTIEVRWPNAACTRTVVTNIPADQFIVINEQGLYTQTPSPHPDQKDFTVFPNPLRGDVLHVQFRDARQKGLIEVYDGYGRKLAQVAADGSRATYEVPVRNMSPGLYWVRVTGGTSVRGMVKSFLKS